MQQKLLFDAIIANNHNLVNEILNEGIDINIPLLYGYSALHWTILKGNLHIAKLIINKNYIPNNNEIKIAKSKGDVFKELYQIVLTGQNKNSSFVIEI